MRDYDTFGDKIVNAIFVTLWLISRPFVWGYLLLKWFVISVITEVGGRLVKIVGGFIAAGIIIYLASLLLPH